MPKFDLAQTQAVAELFAKPREARDEAWRDQFYAAVPDATLMAFDPQVNRGPDEFPYFHLAIPDPGPVTPFCVTHLLDVVLDNGFGIAIFGDSSRSEGPEWVFTYGDLLSYSLFGHFDGDPAERLSTAGSKDNQVLIAAPSEAYLPARARKAMGNFVRRMYHHPDPRIALVHDPQATLMINLTLEDYDGDESKLSAALHYLSWFLPRHLQRGGDAGRLDRFHFHPAGLGRVHRLQNRHALACGPLHRVQSRMLTHGGSVADLRNTEQPKSKLGVILNIGDFASPAGERFHDPIRKSVYRFLIPGLVLGASGGLRPDADRPG